MVIKRKLGKDGPDVSAIGYGAMVLEGFYGSTDESDAITTLRHALDTGMSFIDTADAYGNGHNEELIARAIAGRREDAFIATKFGIVFDPDQQGTEVPTGWGFSLNINGGPDYVRRSLDYSLKRLNTEHIDLWYLHYPDPATPIAETVGAMSEAVSAGKVKFLGLSNVTADQIVAAHKVHPIAAVQYEYSLWRREVETDLLPILRELGIALVPWAPLGSGFLTGTIGDLAADDFRNNNPRYQGENFQANKERFAPLIKVAGELGITPAQLALAWLLHQGEDIIPIPGTRKQSRVTENAAAAEIDLNAEMVERISSLAPPGIAKGRTLV
ncbi:MAG: aldo/keto reductase [Desulfobacterales bacterium]|jgi:aryl-alcohol dehydrogenase-like predicted oxidoreductase